MANERQSQRGRRWALICVASLALSVACGTPEPRGQVGADSSPVSAEPTYNYLTPTVPLTVDQAEQQLSFQLLVPSALPSGLLLQQLSAYPGEDAATLSYVTSSGAADFVVTERSRPWTTADAFWPPHATVEQSTLLFGAQAVTRYVAGWEGCGSATEYVWEQAGVSVAINSFADVSLLSSAQVEQFIAAIIGVAPDAIVAPTATPTPATPERTPYGEYCDLAAAQAMALAPFDLPLPAPPAPLAITRVQLYNVPPGLEARASPPATLTADESITLNQAHVLYTASDATLNVYESSGAGNASFEGPPPIGERSIITFAGVEVTRETRISPNAGDAQPVMQTLRYVWQQGDLTWSLDALLAAGPDASVSQTEVEQLIAGIIAGGS